MKKTIALALAVAITLTAVAQESRIASLVVTNCCESKVDALLLPKLTAVLSTKLSKVGLKTIDPYFFKDKAEEAHGRVTVSVWQLQDAKTYIGVASRNHTYSIRMAINLVDAQTGATVCGGVEVNTNSQSYTAVQVANHGQKYVDELIDAAAADCARQWKRDSGFRKWIDSPLPPPPPPPPPSLPPPPPDDPRLTLSDVDGVVQKHIDSMQVDRVFRDNYNAAQAAIGRIPLVIVGGLKDLTKGKSPTADMDNLLATASLNVRITLLRTRLVDAKDDSVITAMTERIIENGKSPTEDGELMDVLKKHGSPDFIMLGDIRYFDEEKKYYRVRLALHSFHTGKIVWEDFKDVSKNTGVSK